MKTPRRYRSLAVIATVPALALVFWLTAVIASGLPGLLVVGVNVHGLNLTSFAGDPAQRPAPLSLSVLDDARQDTGIPTATATPHAVAPAHGTSTSPTPTATSSGLPMLTPSAATVNPTPTSGSATISGQVTDSQTRQAIVGATVSVSPGGMSALTDVNGNFSFTVAPGTYTVTASAVNYNSASQGVTVSSGQKTSLAFRLGSTTAIGNITGTVTDALTQAPIVGATVTLSNGLIRVTDTNGNFSYTIVLAGSYTLTVSAPGYTTQSQPVAVKAGHTTNVQIALTR
jgi:hypothetical protein